MISKKSVIYRFLCIWWVLINMAPRNSSLPGTLDNARYQVQPTIRISKFVSLGHRKIPGKIPKLFSSDGILKNTDRPVFEVGIHH